MVYGIVLPTLDVIIFDCKATYNWTPSVYMLTPFRSSKLDTSLQRGVSIESIHVRSYCLNCGSRSNVVRNWSFFRSFQCQKSAFLQCYWMPPPGLEHVQIQDPRNHLFFCKPHGPWPDHCAQKTQRGLIQMMAIPQDPHWPWMNPPQAFHFWPIWPDIFHRHPCKFHQLILQLIWVV